MQDHQDQLTKLTAKLESLLQRQDEFSKEIEELKKAILALKTASEIQEPIPDPIVEEEKDPVVEEQPAFQKEEITIEQPVESVQDRSKFYRDPRNKILGGVCSGFANYVGMNVLLVRFIWILISILFCIGILIYLILWMVIPQSEYYGAVAHKTTQDFPPVPIKKPVQSDTTAPKKEPIQSEATASKKRSI